MKLRRLAYVVSSATISLSSLFMLMSPVAHAANITWTGTGGDGKFSTAANWAGNVAPVNGDVVIFDAATLSSNTMVSNDILNLSLAGVTLSGTNSGSARLDITGNAMTLSGTIDNSSNSALAIDPDITLGADLAVMGTGSVSIGTSSPALTVFNMAGHNVSSSDSAVAGLTLYSQITGSGNFSGSGTLLGFYEKTNTFTGSITMSGSSRLEFHEPGTLGNSTNALIFNGSSTMISYLTSGATLPNPITFNSTGISELRVFSNPTSSATLSGAIVLSVNTSLLIGETDVTLTGALSGTGKITPEPSAYNGKLIINSSSNTSPSTNGTYTNGGALLTVSDNSASTNVSVPSGLTLLVAASGTRGNITLSGGTLKGTGTVGIVTLGSGTVAPGQSPGVLNTGNLVFTGGSLNEEIGGTTAGNFDQLNVTGTVNLGSATTLNVSHWNGYLPNAGDKFTIINNDAADAITGTFASLAEGATLTVNGVTYTISYKGGDGNDVVLTATSVPTTAKAPNTGFEKLSNNPLATLVITLIIVAGISLLARKQLAKK